MGTKVCSNGPGHMTKIATTPIYGKHFKILYSRVNDLATWYELWGCGPYQVPRLSLTYIITRSNLIPITFRYDISWKIIFAKPVEVNLIHILTRYFQHTETMIIHVGKY